jgi:hypothetical protein
MLRPGGDEDEEAEQKVRLLESARGWAIVLLGLGISLDELAIGFGVGLLGLPLLLLVGLIAIQALIAAQLGLRLGSRLADSARRAAGQLAGFLLTCGVRAQSPRAPKRYKGLSPETLSRFPDFSHRPLRQFPHRRDMGWDASRTLPVSA